MRACKLSTGWVRLFALLLWILSSLSGALADSWGPPQPTHWSDNRQFVLNVDDTHRTLTLQLQRADSIHWLALCKDHDSGPFLKAAQQDDDPIVRDEAIKALKTLASKDSTDR